MSDTQPTASTERWIPRNGGHYCTAHDYEFERNDVCHECTTDPGPAIGVIDALVVDREAQAAEAEIRSVAKKAKSVAAELLDGTAQEKTVAAKFYDTYLKAMRLWRELRTARLQIESDERLREHDAKMAGLRGSN